jgi:hypothetical protein
VSLRLNRNAVVSLFALLNCARPLAGPPDHRAGSAFAPDFWPEQFHHNFGDTAGKLTEHKIARKVPAS